MILQPKPVTKVHDIIQTSPEFGSVWLHTIEKLKKLQRMECVCIYDRLADVSNLGRYGRAATIEKLFNAASGFEKYTILAAVNLLDRYLSKMQNSESLNVNEVQLTAMVALAVVMSAEPSVSNNTTLCLF